MRDSGSAHLDGAPVAPAPSRARGGQPPTMAAVRPGVRDEVGARKRRRQRRHAVPDALRPLEIGARDWRALCARRESLVPAATPRPASPARVEQLLVRSEAAAAGDVCNCLVQAVDLAPRIRDAPLVRAPFALSQVRGAVRAPHAARAHPSGHLSHPRWRLTPGGPTPFCRETPQRPPGGSPTSIAASAVAIAPTARTIPKSNRSAIAITRQTPFLQAHPWDSRNTDRSRQGPTPG